MSRRAWFRGALVALVLLALAPAAAACPVCFGDTDAPIMRGVEASVLFMVGLTYFLILGGVVTFVLLRRRARRIEGEQAESIST